MSEQTFSPHWYRVAELKPRLRSHASLYRHRYRRQTWYLLHDGVATRYHRYPPNAHCVIGQMNGRRSLQEIWDGAMTELGDDAPTQDETIQLLAQLHTANLIQCDTPPYARELLERREREKRNQLLRWFANPLSQRFPLFDPSALLERCLPIARVCFGIYGVAVWALLVCYALTLLATHWPEIRQGIGKNLFSPDKVLLACLVYPVIKALHELGHAFVTRLEGGEVREMGIMMLVLVPIPYVDASAAAAFPNKYRRMAVGAAGIMVEVFLACVALLVWVNVEPGLVRDTALTVMLVGGVSTVLFNGNPLLKFDGYHVFADWIEIPNLAARANKYLGYLVQRYVFGLREAESPASAPGEPGWFVCYGIAAGIYRLVILVSIVFYIAGKFLLIGVVLAAWCVSMQLLLPLVKQLWFVASNPVLSGHRLRAVGLMGFLFGTLGAAILLVPLPIWTYSEGVVWLPEDAHVRAEADGFVINVYATLNSWVRRGDRLLETEHRSLQAEVEVLSAKFAEVAARHAAELRSDRVQANIIADEMRTVEADLNRAREQLGSLMIRAPADGVFIVSGALDLDGRFVRQGEVVGYVVERASQRVRTVVSQNDLARVRLGTTAVRVTFVDRPWETLSAHITREVPSAQYLLPSPVLGTQGGGRIAVEPSDERGVKATDKVFQIELEVPDYNRDALFGERVYVRFDHGKEPLADQSLRFFRQLLLSRFNV